MYGFNFSHNAEIAMRYAQEYAISTGNGILDIGHILAGLVSASGSTAAEILSEKGVTKDAVAYTLKTFSGVEHRIELVRVKDGVRYYNDSIASSPSRTIAGLRSFKEKVLLIAGGYDKHIPYGVLGPEICEHVKTVYVNGATAMQIKAAVENAPQYVVGAPKIVVCDDFTDAVMKAASDAVSGDVVLMSPASAAFDQFKNFMERGKYFKKLVSEL